MIEANIGRPTGRSATAETGGVELLATMYCDAAGLPLPADREQRYVGAAWIDLRRDLISAVYHWRRGELGPVDWFRSLRGPTAHAVLSVRDPLPFMHRDRPLAPQGDVARDQETSLRGSGRALALRAASWRGAGRVLGRG